MYYFIVKCAADAGKPLIYQKNDAILTVVSKQKPIDLTMKAGITMEALIQFWNKLVAIIILILQLLGYTRNNNENEQPAER